MREPSSGQGCGFSLEIETRITSLAQGIASCVVRDVASRLRLKRIVKPFCYEFSRVVRDVASRLRLKQLEPCLFWCHDFVVRDVASRLRLKPSEAMSYLNEKFRWSGMWLLA